MNTHLVRIGLKWITITTALALLVAAVIAGDVRYAFAALVVVSLAWAWRHLGAAGEPETYPHPLDPNMEDLRLRMATRRLQREARREQRPQRRQHLVDDDEDCWL